MQCSKCGSPLNKNVKFCANCGTPISEAPTIEKDLRLVAFEEVLGQKYKILKKLGAGGFAEVYLGEHTQLGRKVAIKILHQNYSMEEAMVERFRRESKAAAKLSHPNIIDIYDVGEGNGIYYFVMKYVEGETLSRKMSREKRIAPQEAVHIIKQLADALAYAHTNDVIHRDLKPANVMLDLSGKPVLMDFGIARIQFEGNLTKTGTLMGTPHYLPPEQPLGKPVDGRSDIYSLGILFYEMLAGRPPFHDENSVALIFKHINEPPPPLASHVPELAPELCEIVHKMLQKLPEDRYQSGSEVVEALDNLSGIYPTPATGGKKSTPGTPRNTEQLLLLAKENLKQQKFDRAIEIYGTIFKRDPLNEIAKTAVHELEALLSERLSQHISAKEFGEAKIIISQMERLSVNPKTLVSLRAKLEAEEQKQWKVTEFQSHFDAARAALEHDNATGAIERLTKALTIDPANPEARELLKEARAAYEQNRQKAEFANAFSEAEYYFNNHSYEQALLAVKRALDIENDPRALEMLEKINASLKEKAYRKGEQERILNEIDELCEKLQFNEALQVLEQTRENFPLIMDSKINMVERNRALYAKFMEGKTHFDAKRWTEAGNSFQEFLGTSPPYDFQAFYSLRKEAEDLSRTAARESTLSDQSEAQRRATGEVEQQLRKADVLVRMGQLEEARQQCLHILEKNKDHPLVLAKLNEIEDLISPKTKLQKRQAVEQPQPPEEISSKTMHLPSGTEIPVPPVKTEPVERRKPRPSQEIRTTVPVDARPSVQPHPPPKVTAPQPAAREPRERRSFPVGLTVAILAVVLVAGLFAAILWLPKTPVNPEQAPPKPGRPVVIPPPAATPLHVSIDAQPWANIRISGGDLRSSINETTPAAVQLPPGRYTVIFTNPDLPTFSEIIDVDPANTNFSYSFKQLNAEKLVDQLVQ
jgi:serine/threonine protein kinase